MRAHRTKAAELVRLLAYMVKDPSLDKSELYFLGSGQRCKSDSSSKLYEAVVGRPPYGTTELSERLGQILLQYGHEIDDYERGPSRIGMAKTLLGEKKPPTPKSIYILTDGRLKAGDEEQGYTEIRRIVYQLHYAGFTRNQLGIQFVSFGDDPDGLKRLDMLDHLARHENQLLPL